MGQWSSGRRLREIGLGETVRLPSDSLERDFVLHGKQTQQSVSQLLGHEATPEDLARANLNADSNQKLDQYTREALAEGARYGAAAEREKQAQTNHNQGAGRMAGTALAGAGGAAGLIALIQQLQSPKIETTD